MKLRVTRADSLEKACPDCGDDMILRKSKHGKFYGCVNYPKCRATHGAHDNGKPYGIPANSATKEWRMMAHADFDMLWKGDKKVMSRKDAYHWLQKAMGIEKAEDAHIGKFDVQQCRRLLGLVQLRIGL